MKTTHYIRLIELARACRRHWHHHRYADRPGDPGQHGTRRRRAGLSDADPDHPANSDSPANVRRRTRRHLQDLCLDVYAVPQRVRRAVLRSVCVPLREVCPRRQNRRAGRARRRQQGRLCARQPMDPARLHRHLLHPRLCLGRVRGGDSGSGVNAPVRRGCSISLARVTACEVEDDQLTGVQGFRFRISR